MRLSDAQVSQIYQAVSRFLGDFEFKIYLYGSRTQDHLKGGDIDLLVLTSERGVEKFNQKNLDILVCMKNQSEIGQRKIDIKAITQTDLDTIPFFQTIQKNMILLKSSSSSSSSSP